MKKAAQYKSKEHSIIEEVEKLADDESGFDEFLSKIQESSNAL